MMAAMGGPPDHHLELGGALGDRVEEERHKKSAEKTVEVTLACRTFVSSLEDALAKNPEIRTLLGTLNQQTLQNTFASIDVSSVLNLEYAQAIFRKACGIQPWLLAPEPGVRLLLKDSVELCRRPMMEALSTVNSALLLGVEIAGARCAALPAGHGGRRASVEEMQGKAHLADELVSRAKQCIARWKADTGIQLDQVLLAEGSFPSPSKLQALKSNLERLLLERQREEAAKAAKVAALAMLAVAESMGSQEPGPLLVAAKEQLVAKEEIEAVAPKESVPSKEEVEEAQDNVYFMGWIEKLNRSRRWDMRWFVLSGEQQQLFYFKHPEETPARGSIHLKDVKLISQPPHGLWGKGGTSMPIFHLQASKPAGALHSPAKVDPSRSVLTLRCPDEATKKEWVTRIRLATQEAHKPPVLKPAIAPQAPTPLEQQPVSSATSLCRPCAPVGIPRKISTKVYSQDEGPATYPHHSHPRQALAADNGQGTGIAQGSSSNEASEGEEEAEGKAGFSEDAADALIREIEAAQRAQQASMTEHEQLVLECVIEGCKPYVEAAHTRLVDLTSKLVVKCMLDRGEDLFRELLGLLGDGAQT